MVQARKGKAEEVAGSVRQAEREHTRLAAREDRPGTGALCPEAQADGVPCFEVGRDCEVCEHARLDESGTVARGSRKRTR